MSHESNPLDVIERRNKIASMVAKKLTEREIASQLNLTQSMVHRDIVAIRGMAQQFVYDLGRSDLAFYYSQSLTGIDDAIKGIWEMLDNPDNNKEVDMKRLAAYKAIIDAHKSKFELLNSGPSVMAMRSMNDRLERIEKSSSNNNEITEISR